MRHMVVDEDFTLFPVSEDGVVKPAAWGDLSHKKLRNFWSENQLRRKVKLAGNVRHPDRSGLPDRKNKNKKTYVKKISDGH